MGNNRSPLLVFLLFLFIGGPKASLAAPGTISGTVIDSQSRLPLTGVMVEAYAQQGNTFTLAKQASTNAAGQYSLDALEEGSYYLRTRNTSAYIDKLHANIACGSCNLIAGTPVTVAAQANVSIPFELEKGGRIEGTVTSARGGAALSGFEVHVFSSNGSFAASARTDSAGHYATGAGLLFGNYFVKTAQRTGYVAQLYNGIDCNACDVRTGTPVAVVDPTAVRGIDFRLKPWGRITGRITDAQTGNPVPYHGIRVYNRHGASVATTYTVIDGTYSVTLQDSSYFVATDQRFLTKTYIDELWNNIACGLNGCDAIATTGNLIDVASPNIVENINFVLDRNGASIEGKVVDRISRSALPYATIVLVDANGQIVMTTDANPTTGDYRMVGIPPGSYKLSAHQSGYAGQMYNNVTCSKTCDYTKANGIALTTGAIARIDFDLDPLGHLEGHVIDRLTSRPIANATVQLYDSDGTWLTLFLVTDEQGRYTSQGQVFLYPDLNYYAQVTRAYGYDPQLFDGKRACLDSGCLVTQGTPIRVPVRTASTANFSLLPLGRISGKVFDAATNAPVAGARIFFDGPRTDSTTTDDAGNYSTGPLPTGSYRRIMASKEGYALSVYPCGSHCLIEESGTVELGNGATPIIDFALQRGGSIQGTITDAQTGTPLAGIYIDYWHPRRNQPLNWQQHPIFTDSAGRFATPRSLGAGDYHLSVWTNRPYYPEFYNDIGCLTNRCDDLGSRPTPISVTSGNATEIAIRLTPTTQPRTGKISGRVFERLTSRPIVGARITLYNSSGTSLPVTAGSTDLNGEFTIGDLAPGHYYALASGSGYRSVLYSGILCDPACVITTGTPISVQSLETRSIEFEMYSGIAIHDVTPASGDVIGGTSVTIRGTGFKSGLTVKFGSAHAIVHSVDSTTIRVTSPPGTAGPVTITITNPDGIEASLAGAFVYSSQCVPPAITHETSNQSASWGSRVRLSISHSGTEPFVYQWYRGTRGDVSHPIGGSSPIIEVGPIRSDESYWVHVKNICGDAASNTMLVKVIVKRRRGVGR